MIAPLFKTSPTDYGTLYTVLRLTQGISATVVGPQRKTLIMLDLDLYSRALKIQQSVGNTNWILRAGALHIAFATLHALGKTVDGSGLDTCAIESAAYTSAALRGIFGPVRVQCITLKDKLHSRNPDMIEVYEDVRSWYSGNVKPQEEEKDIGEFAEFLSAYLDQVESLFRFISSCCSGDWQSYLASL